MAIDMAKKMKFGVYFDDELIEIIKAESQEEAEAVVYSEIEEVPSHLKYKGKIIYEDFNASDEVNDAFENKFWVKPLKEKIKEDDVNFEYFSVKR